MHKLSPLLFIGTLVLNLAACTASQNAAPTDLNKTAAAVMATQDDYVKVCGICHLEDGVGVPGAFPPLDSRLAALADSEAGRNYLAGLLKNGLYGPITVNNIDYNGAMPPLAYQLSAEEMAGLLNYAMQTFAEKKANFSATEITERLQAIGNTTGAQLRKQAL